ncbi:MAG: DNA translocase FtsK [Ignavibacteriales bacterium]|nr:DNA translocase FtsK [Ignavibacteriales bacterium]
MAVKRRNTKNTKPNNSNSYFIIPIEKKKKLLGVLLCALALIVLLSILSYSSYDHSNFTYRLDEFFEKIFDKSTQSYNWMGVFGAYVSNFLINSTIGYFSIIFPIILFLWGYTIIRREPYKFFLQFSNIVVSIGVLLASFFGLLQHSLDIFIGTNELSGKVGFMLGSIIGRFLGPLGGIIFFLVLLGLIIAVIFDVKFHKVMEFIKKLWNKVFERRQEQSYDRKIGVEDRSQENLRKIKRMREQEENGQLISEPISKETKIKILQTDNKPIIDPFAKEEDEKIKKIIKDTEKNDKIEIDILKEEKLPNQWEEDIDFIKPNLALLNDVPDESLKVPEEELKHNAELLKEKLKLFDIDIEDITVIPGPVVTLYEIVPAPGVKISRIVSLEDDIALALSARGIRIIAPIPGKSVIGVEIPNNKPAIVNAKPILAELKNVDFELPLALGKTISGEPYITDLTTMPHLLIAGSTGSGKSVGINMMLASMIYSKHPSEVKFVIIDPKKIELSYYKGLRKHYLAVSPDMTEEIITTPMNAINVLKSVEIEMEKRYEKLARIGARSIIEYNRKIELSNKKNKPDGEGMIHYKLPYLIIVIDELADLMITSAKEVEAPIARIAQMARAVGIHLILATQRPSVNVITGVIKANFPARIAYQVATKIDSRTILDMNGAEQLLGKGDMLFLPGNLPKPIRIQNAYLSTDEVEKVTNHIYKQEGYTKRFLLPSVVEKKNAKTGTSGDWDEALEEAARVIVRHQQGSVSLLQRRLKLGYSRAARIVDQLEELGIVGPSEGSKAREVFVENEEELKNYLRGI